MRKGLRKLVLELLRQYLRLGMFFYYKRFKVYGKENIPQDGSVVFLPNHRNMLIDPLLVAVSNRRFPTFLTRSDVFVKGFVDKALRYIGLLPIYRIRDGYSSLKRNQAIFDLSAERLAEKDGTVLLFPEGSSHMVQRVRPLSKGFTRLVFHALDKNGEQPLSIQPIGLNYQYVDRFPDSVSVYYQPVLDAHEYRPNEDNLNEQIVHLKADVQSSLEEVVTCIPKDGYEEKRAALLESKTDLTDALVANQLIASDVELTPHPDSFLYRVFKQTVKVLLIVCLLPVYLLWKRVARSQKEPDMLDTFRFVLAIFLVPIYLLVLFFILQVLFSLKAAALVIGGIVLLELVYVKI